MSARDETIRVISEWVEKAEQDIINAEHTLTLENRCPFDTVCFHAQQCAEKYIKAVLVERSVPFPKSHDLLELLALVPEEAALGLQPSDVSTINRYAVEARYPSCWEPQTRPAAEAAVADARRVREAARAVLPDEALQPE